MLGRRVICPSEPENQRIYCRLSNFKWFFLKVNKSTATVSTTISLLSTLCRGSEAITHNLLRSNLAEAIESALQGDERCTLDTMRLIDLLLVLLFEGKFFFVCCYFCDNHYFFFMLSFLTTIMNHTDYLPQSQDCAIREFLFGFGFC